MTHGHQQNLISIFQFTKNVFLLLSKMDSNHFIQLCAKYSYTPSHTALRICGPGRIRTHNPVANNHSLYQLVATDPFSFCLLLQSYIFDTDKSPTFSTLQILLQNPDDTLSMQSCLGWYDLF